MENLFSEDNNGAVFSECRKYRYVLWRKWDISKQSVLFIGLNPSTANETTDDPTIKRVKKFAFDWGYGGVYMMNLFAYVTAYPKELKQCKDPLADNDKWLIEISSKCGRVIFAWGSFKESEERSKEVIKMFDGYALMINQDGSPRHPLYVKSNIKPIKFLKPLTNKEVMKEYEVWIEGYAATGESQRAHCEGRVQANSFEEACIKLLGDKLDKDQTAPDGYSRHYGGLSVWACRCFDNETDARKSFG